MHQFSAHEWASFQLVCKAFYMIIYDKWHQHPFLSFSAPRWCVVCFSFEDSRTLRCWNCKSQVLIRMGEMPSIAAKSTALITDRAATAKDFSTVGCPNCCSSRLPIYDDDKNTAQCIQCRHVFPRFVKEEPITSTTDPYAVPTPTNYDWRAQQERIEARRDARRNASQAAREKERKLKDLERRKQREELSARWALERKAAKKVNEQMRRKEMRNEKKWRQRQAKREKKNCIKVKAEQQARRRRILLLAIVLIAALAILWRIFKN